MIVIIVIIILILLISFISTIIWFNRNTVNKWANIPGVYIQKIEPITDNSQIKIYDGGPMGDKEDLQTSIDIATAMEHLNFSTYCPARDGFALIDALTQISNDNEKKYYLYAGISSIDFYQLLVECQIAFFDVRPYWSDNCVNNPDNGTVVELAVASTCNKHRTFYKKCNLKNLESCLKNTANCQIPENSKNKSCQELSIKVEKQKFFKGACTRELGGNNAFNGWDNPMLLALAMNNAFQTGNDSYAYSNLDKALTHMSSDVLKYKLITYKIYDYGTKKFITHKALDSQMPFAILPKLIQNQILLGYHLNESQKGLTNMTNKIDAFVNVVKQMGVKYYGIEPWNKFKCPTN
jgi:hypothetical protein